MKSKRQILVMIVGVVLFFAIPIIINYLILQPKQFPFVGEGVDWLMFWGSYLGAAISAAIAFIILHIQRRDNEKQNEENRQLQINILVYQQERARLDNLQKMFTDILTLNAFNDIIDIARAIDGGELQKINDSLRITSDKITYSMAEFSMEFMLVDSDSYRVGRYTDWYFRKYSRTLRDISVVVAVAQQDMSMSIDKFSNIIDNLPPIQVSAELKRVVVHLKGNKQLKQCKDIAGECIMTLLNMRIKEHTTMGDMFNKYLHTQRQKIDKMLTQPNK